MANPIFLNTYTATAELLKYARGLIAADRIFLRATFTLAERFGEIEAALAAGIYRFGLGEDRRARKYIFRRAQDHLHEAFRNKPDALSADEIRDGLRFAELRCRERGDETTPDLETLRQSIKLLREARSLIANDENHLRNGYFFATRMMSGELRMERKRASARAFRPAAFCAMGALQYLRFYSKGMHPTRSPALDDQVYPLVLSSICAALQEKIGDRLLIDRLCLSAYVPAERRVCVANDLGSHKAMLKLMRQAESLLRNLKKALQAAAGGVIGIPADQS